VTVSEYQQAHLHAVSRRSTEVDDLALGEHDLAVLVSSWDARCVAITASTTLSANRSVVVIFDQTDDLGLREQHDIRLKEFAGQRAARTDVVAGNSVDVPVLWERLFAAIVAARLARQRPLRLLVEYRRVPASTRRPFWPMY
jgi:hypothetical protein